MRIAIAGKGGSGKTTIAGTLARLLARRGRTVKAIDADSNPNLAVSLGVDPAVAFNLAGLPPDLLLVQTDEMGNRTLALKKTPAQIFEEFGVDAPDGIRLLVGSRVNHAGAGWNCNAHSTVRGIIRELGTDGADMTVLDLEAGLEHLKRGTPRHTDALLVVAEPYFRSLETATRTAALGRELGIPQVGFVANKVRDDRDEDMIRQVVEPHGVPVLAVVPFDQSVLVADRTPAALIDVDPDSPAVRAVVSLVEILGELEATASGG